MNLNKENNPPYKNPLKRSYATINDKWQTNDTTKRNTSQDIEKRLARLEGTMEAMEECLESIEEHLERLGSMDDSKDQEDESGEEN